MEPSPPDEVTVTLPREVVKWLADWVQATGASQRWKGAAEACRAALAEPVPVSADDCQYVNAEGKLWVCRVCGAPVILNVGDKPLAKKCSKEFGRFDNVTSREAGVYEKGPVPAEPEPPRSIYVPVEDRRPDEPERPEWVLHFADDQGILDDDVHRVVLAGHLQTGDVVLWGDGRWHPIDYVTHTWGWTSAWINGSTAESKVEYPPAALVVVRVSGDGQ